jgi:hypothetical protein
MERKTRLNTVSSRLNAYHTTGGFVRQRTLKVQTCEMDWILEEEECENLPSRAFDILITKKKLVAVIALIAIVVLFLSLVLLTSKVAGYFGHQAQQNASSDIISTQSQAVVSSTTEGGDTYSADTTTSEFGGIQGYARNFTELGNSPHAVAFIQLSREVLMVVFSGLEAKSAP